MASRVIFSMTLIIFTSTSFVHTAKETKKINDNNFLSIIDNVIGDKLGDVVSYTTKRLAAFNDEHFGKTAVGRMINYEEIKPNLEFESGRSK